jgi:hypothetical protein
MIFYLSQTNSILSNLCREAQQKGGVNGIGWTYQNHKAAVKNSASLLVIF